MHQSLVRMTDGVHLLNKMLLKLWDIMLQMHSFQRTGRHLHNLQNTCVLLLMHITGWWIMVKLDILPVVVDLLLFQEVAQVSTSQSYSVIGHNTFLMVIIPISSVQFKHHWIMPLLQHTMIQDHLITEIIVMMETKKLNKVMLKLKIMIPVYMRQRLKSKSCIQQWRENTVVLHGVIHNYSQRVVVQ